MTIAFSLVCFVGVFRLISPVNINNMGGMHSWLSGSTMKFVNNWLDEGAAELNFTNYEDPASVEFQNLRDREPYLSYPSGETFFVYVAAKVTGKQQITIPFLHKFQIVMFAIEAVLFACFVYCFLSRTLKMKGDVTKVAVSVLTAVLWMILPVCSYYLSNIYYAYQCVILFVMAFVLIEYLIRTNTSKNNLWLKIIRSVILFSGVLIDYYFWFVALFFFLAELVFAWLQNKKGQRKKELLSVTGWFGIPVVLALIVFFIQLNLTSGWLEIMKDRFNERVMGGEKTIDWIMGMIFSNFAQAFSLGNETVFYLIFLLLVGVIGGVVILILRKKVSALVRNPGVSVMLCGILAIVFQIFFFSNHSAVHEFSMIKVGWIIALLPLFLSVICYLLIEKNYLGVGKCSKKFFLLYVLCYLLVFFAVGLPVSTKNYSTQRLEAVDYSFESMIAEQTDYNDVVFSYSLEIPINPPQSLAISRKRIYKIDDLEEMSLKMNGLVSDAKSLLVVDKKAGSDVKLKKQIECLHKNGKKRFEDDSYLLLEVNEYKKCMIPNN